MTLEGYLFLGGGAGVAALAIALVFATTVRRLLALLAVGVVLAVGLYGFFELSGAFEPDDSSMCTDCGLGALIAIIAVVGNSIGWTVGTLVGGAVRLAARRSRSGGATEPSSSRTGP